MPSESERVLFRTVPLVPPVEFFIVYAVPLITNVAFDVSEMLTFMLTEDDVVVLPESGVGLMKDTLGAEVSGRTRKKCSTGEETTPAESLHL